MTFVLDVALAGLVVAAALAAGRIIRGPSVVDRVVGLETVVVTVLMGIGIVTARTGNAVLLDILVVVALLGFVATVSIARFIEERGV